MACGIATALVAASGAIPAAAADSPAGLAAGTSPAATAAGSNADPAAASKPNQTAVAPKSTTINTVPTKVIGGFYDALLEIMRNADKLHFRGRFEALKPAIEQAFNLPLMTQLAIGPQWSALSVERRQKLVEAFSHYTVAIYASRFDGYDGETFVVEGEPIAQGNGLIVLSKLMPQKGDPIELNYLMRNGADGWQVIDIYLSGTISELATRRSEFTAVLGRDGPDALIALITRKSRDLESK